MTIIGITGSFGTGKSFVASVFKSLGAKVLDADKIAHKLLKKGAPAYEETVDLFGAAILAKNKDIDRGKLAAIVFADREKLEKLNSIIHPKVIREIKDKIESWRGEKAVVIDAPLLIEANLEGMVDKLVVVKASKDTQIARCSKKFGIDEDECMARINNQMPLREKLERADFIIDNEGTKAQTKKQVTEIWRKAWK